jgi:divalent metal cation (Fe/Co/Zn/Cd) transporter
MDNRAEPLITFIVVGFLITSATIAYESILNIRIAHDSPKPWTLLVLGAIIIWKEYSFRLVMRSVETNSSSLKQMHGIIGAMQLLLLQLLLEFLWLYC